MSSKNPKIVKVYPKTLWELIEWAKRTHGIITKIETNTSAHGGCDVDFRLRSNDECVYRCVEKTFLQGRSDEDMILRWAKNIEKELELMRAAK
jgi:hypothetical protein